MGLTDEVEALVADGRWQDASQIESQRRRLLELYVAGSNTRQPGLEDLYERSRRTLAAAQHSRNALFDESKKLTQAKQAVKAYREQSARPTITRRENDESRAIEYRRQ